MKEIPITSFRNLKIGQAENTAAGTGCTVFLLGQEGAPAGLDVRGGGPASRESELLKPLAAAQVIHAIVLAGGSAFGLDAAGGVMRYLEERGIGFDVGVTKVPLVCQSDLFDLTVADAHTRPDAAMAYQACVNAEAGNYRDGSYGAGTGATVGKLLGMDHCMKSGIGAAMPCRWGRCRSVRLWQSMRWAIFTTMRRAARPQACWRMTAGPSSTPSCLRCRALR